jgi:hypothetical protein
MKTQGLQKCRMVISFKEVAIYFCVAFFGLNSHSNELSCDMDINCDRFEYTSVERFKQSVIDYAEKHHLNSPGYVLHSVSDIALVKVKSMADGLIIIEENPGLIYSMGRNIESSNKPKEWRYAFEQSFIRSFNSLKR